MEITGKTILVTGAGGHLGGHIVEQLQQEGAARIIAVDRAFPADAELLRPLEGATVTRAECDITRSDELRKWVRGADAVVHSASLLSREVGTELRKAYDVNIGGMMGLLETCVAEGVRRFVFTSSSSVYHGHPLSKAATPEETGLNPVSMYGVSKATGELLLRVFRSVHGLEYVALRIASIYGIRQSHRSNLARVVIESFDRVEQGLPPLIHGDGSQTYDFVDVVDVARAHILALKSAVSGKSYNVATGVATSIADVIRTIIDVAGSSVEPLHAEQGNRYSIPNERLDPTNAERDLGFRAQRSLRDGLQGYFEWRTRLKGMGVTFNA